MSKKFNNAIIFVVGAAVGSLVTWKLVETKYKRIAQEEIDSVKEAFEEMPHHIVYQHDDEEKEAPVTAIEETEGEVKAPIDLSNKPSLMEYAKTLDREGYVDYSASNKNIEEEKPMEKYDAPYLISPDDFGEIDGYEKITLVYYADHVLEDDMGDIIDPEDIEDVVGDDYMNHFGENEFEPDSVYIRNDARKTDYEILRDNSRYNMESD